MAKIDDLLVAARARISERNDLVSSIISSGRASVRMQGKNGFALVGPDMSVTSGGFRVTYFGIDGSPNGHVEHVSYSGALNMAFMDGYKEA